MIEIKNLSFPLSDPFLKNINFSPETGSITGITGRSGSGKSLFMELLSLRSRAKELRPVIQFRDRKASLFTEKELSAGIAFVNEKTVFDRNEILERYLLSSRLPLKNLLQPFCEKDYEITDSCIKAFGLNPWRNRKTDTLSPGIIQRARLAMAFIRQPELMLIDEPFRDLDPEGIILFSRELRRFSMEGRGTVVFASSDPGHTAEISDRIIILNRGRTAENIKAVDITADMIKKYFGADCLVSRNIYTGRPVINTVTEI